MEYDKIIDNINKNSLAYENLVISLIAGKTAEEVDLFNPDQETLEHAGHFYRQINMGEQLNPDNISENYFKEIVINGPNIKKFEHEIEYLKKYNGQDNMLIKPILCCDIPISCYEYDGRDDIFIQDILNHKSFSDLNNYNDIKLSDDTTIEDPISNSEFEIFNRYIK